MIITKTPISFSLLGNGTDVVSWVSQNYGLILNFCINKYVYVIARIKNKFEKKETVDNEIVELVFKHFEKNKINCSDIKIDFFSDLPDNNEHKYALIFGLVKSIFSLKSIYCSNVKLISFSQEIAMTLFKDKCSYSKIYASCFGGISFAKLNKNNDISYSPLKITNEQIHFLQKRIFIYLLTENNQDNIELNEKEKWTILRYAEDGLESLLSFNIDRFLNIVKNNFKIKHLKCTGQNSIEFINKCMFSKLESFDLSDNLCYGIIYSKEDAENTNLKLLKDFEAINFKFDFNGSQIIL